MLNLTLHFLTFSVHVLNSTFPVPELVMQIKLTSRLMYNFSTRSPHEVKIEKQKTTKDREETEITK